jgi:hypothetical protein
MARSATGTLLGVCAALACAAPAHADRIAVPPPLLSGGGQPVRTALRVSIAGGVAAAGHESIALEVVDRALATTPAIAACDTALCLARLADLVGARAAVRATVELLGSSNYSFRLELIDAATHSSLARVEDSCPICTSREANEAISRVAAALARHLSAAKPTAVAAPAAAPAPAAAAPSRSYTPRGRLLLGLGVATLALGAGAVGGGAALLALDGRERFSTDPVTHDPVTSRFEGKIPGAILCAGGGLLLIGGGLLIWRASLAKSPTRH